MMPLFGSKKKKKDKESTAKEKNDGKINNNNNNTKTETRVTKMHSNDGSFTKITTETRTTTQTIVTKELAGGSVMLSKPKTRQPLPNVSNSMGRYSDGREYRIRAPLTPVTYQAIKPSSDALQFDPKHYGIQPYNSAYSSSLSSITQPRPSFTTQNVLQIPLQSQRQRSYSASTPVTTTAPNRNQLLSSNTSITEISDEGLKINVKKSREIMRPLNNKLETYNTASKNRGYVFMINNVKYKVATQYRNGAKIDEKNLTELFTQMNFKVDVHNDKKAKEMQKLLTQHRSNMSLRKYDMSIIIVMGHGHGNSEGNTTVLGVDDEYVQLGWILEQFNSKNCVYLKDKPKIFIFQCCRGSNQQEVVQHDSVPFVGPRDYGDMLIAYSTIPGYVSYRTAKSGSWYIENLCKIFMEHAYDTDVEALLKLVDKELSKINNNHGLKQTSNYENRGFHKLCYINPGK